LCNKKDVGRCVYYKSKNGIKIDFIVDTVGAPLDVSIATGNENDSTIAIKRLNIIANKVNSKKYENSNKFKPTMLNDAIYDSLNFKTKANDNGFKTIIAPNIRNIKNIEKLKNKKLNSKDKKKLKRDT
jgi:hypothetical protein